MRLVGAFLKLVTFCPSRQASPSPAETLQLHHPEQYLRHPYAPFKGIRCLLQRAGQEGRLKPTQSGEIENLARWRVKTYSIAEVAWICQVEDNQVQKWIDTGQLQGFRAADTKEWRVAPECIYRLARARQIQLRTPGKRSDAPELPLPRRLAALIGENVWPQTEAAIRDQRWVSAQTRAPLQFSTPGEVLLFCASPFCRPIDNGISSFWGVPEVNTAVDLNLALEIGELRCDSPVLLDYQFDLSCPRVIVFRWSSMRWEQLASTFDNFWDAMEPVDAGRWS